MSQTNDPPSGQRGISPVVGRRRAWFSKKTIGIALFVAVAAVTALTFWRNANPPEEPIKEKLPEKLGVVVPYTPPPLVLPPAPQTPPPQPKFEEPFKPLVLPKQDPIAQTASGVSLSRPEQPKPHLLSYADPPPANDGRPGAAAGQGASGITYAASRIDGIEAGLMGDQTFLLKPGLVPCIMDTAINSTFEGPIECHIPFDIRPRNVTLLDRNSIVHGTYSNKVQEGQSRVFVAAEWIDNPVTGCFISLGNAPLSDGIGMAGIAASVDHKYLERFGAAVMMDIGQSAFSLAQAALSKGGNTYLSFSSGGGMESIASAILQKQINIPAEMTVHQGDTIAVFVNKVLNFNKCYSLQIKDRR